MDVSQFLSSLDRWNPGLPVLLGFVTLIIVFVQLLVMRRQTSLTRRQLEIVDKQAELMRAQLARRADLRLLVNVKERDQSLRLEFRAENAGNKTASDFQWHVFIPTLGSDQRTFAVVERILHAEGVVKVKEIDCVHFRGSCRDPIYPSDQVVLGSFNFGFPPPERLSWVEIHWRIIAEDGKFPPEKELGIVFVKI